MLPNYYTRKTILFLIFLCCFTVWGIGQNSTTLYEKYNSIAYSFYEESQQDSSLFYYKLARTAAIKEGNLDRIISANNWVAILHYYNNKPDSLNFYLNTVVAQVDSLTKLRKYHEGVMLWWNLKSAYSSAVGEEHQAVAATKKSIYILEQQQKKDTANLIRQYQNIATECGNIGDFINGINYGKQAWELAENVGSEIKIGERISILNTLAWLHKEIGDLTQSNFYFNKLFTCFENYPELKKTHIRLYGLALLNTAGYFYLKEDYAKAEKRLLKALQIAESSDKVRKRFLPNVLNRLGLLSLRKNKKEQAIVYLERALKISKKHFGNKNTYTAKYYYMLAQIHEDEPLESLFYYQKALTAIVHNFNDSTGVSNPNLSQTTSSKKELLTIIQAKANLLQQMEQDTLALSTYKLAINLLDTLRFNYEASGSKFLLQNKAVPIYEGAIQAALKLNEKELAFQFAEKNKAVSLLDNINNLQAKTFAKIPETTLEKERSLKIEMAFAERKLFEVKQKDKPEDVARWEQNSFNLKRNYQKFLQALESNYPKYYHLKYNAEMLAVAQVQNHLIDEGTALIEYFVGDSTIVTFLITKEFLKVFNLPKMDNFNEKIALFRKELARPSRQIQAFENFTSLSFGLYKELVEPCMQHLNENVSKLLFVSDDILHYLPFQTLIQQGVAENFREARYDTLHYLVKDYSMSYAYSATLLYEMKNGATQPERVQENFMGFAPIYTKEKTIVVSVNDDSPRSAVLRSFLPPLPHSGKEITEIRTIVGGKVFKEQAAQKASFIKNANQSRILHLATHATVNDSFPANSCIHFIAENLTVGEVYNLPLDAELVVLSACETGTGQLQKGEGLVSLARAFTYAGCPGLLTSLWQVDDYKTAQLMVGFYEYLYAVQSKDEALQTAQIAYLKNPSQSYTYKHPYYWGGFILLGNVNPVFENSMNCGLWVMLIIMLLLTVRIVYGTFSSKKSYI